MGQEAIVMIQTGNGEDLNEVRSHMGLEEMENKEHLKRVDDFGFLVNWLMVLITDLGVSKGRMAQVNMF